MEEMTEGIVRTIPDRCKRCFSCIRECPAKAIKVESGQAKVLPERCIVCGHCVKVCAQNAKQVKSYVNEVESRFLTSGNTIAIVAPSFSASFPDNYQKVPSAIRALGFTEVIETAFGADLIRSQYLQEFSESNNKPVIASSCPAVANFIKKYYDGLVPNLAKVVSPMVALGRYLKENKGNDINVVFIGPCVAKKDEFLDDEVKGAIDSVITFNELKEMFKEKEINVDEMPESHFDPPHASLGKAYPLAGGLLKSTELPGDVLDEEIIVVEGKTQVLEIIEEIQHNKINAKFIDILFCKGCISGPAIDTDLNYYSRREKVIEFIKQSIKQTDKKIWNSDLYNSREIDFRRKFIPSSQRRQMPTEDQIRNILADTGKYTEAQELNCGACGYTSCREHAIAVAKGLGEKEMCLQYLINEIQAAYENLRTTQEQLHSAEKLASIGQLAAGVAHEINNPLGTIMLYAGLLKRQMKKIAEEDATSEDLELIIKEANRCKNIVSNLLNFARQGKLNISEFDAVELLNFVIKKIKADPAKKEVEIELNSSDKTVLMEGDREQIEQVLLNVINNGIEAMEHCNEKKLSVTLEHNDDINFTIADTGSGIEEEDKKKIFTPFFTTKKMGKGTGLGLAISYGIVKMHKGDISFRSETGNGTTFFISLPRDITAKKNEEQILKRNLGEVIEHE